MRGTPLGNHKSSFLLLLFGFWPLYLSLRKGAGWGGRIHSLSLSLALCSLSVSLAPWQPACPIAAALLPFRHLKSQQPLSQIYILTLCQPIAPEVLHKNNRVIKTQCSSLETHYFNEPGVFQECLVYPGYVQTGSATGPMAFLIWAADNSLMGPAWTVPSDSGASSHANPIMTPVTERSATAWTLERPHTNQELTEFFGHMSIALAYSTASCRAPLTTFGLSHILHRRS